MRENGALQRIKGKWSVAKTNGCNNNSNFTPIPFADVVSLFALLLFGMFVASIIILCEKMYYKKQKDSTNYLGH